MIDINDIKRGMTLIIENEIVQIVDFLHVKPGKGSAFMKIKTKNMRTGNTLERNFNTNLKFEEARIERSTVQYLYNAGDTYCFMNMETYDQFELTEAQIKDTKDFLLENMEVNIAQYNGELLGITLPEKVEYTIVKCDPAVKGNTQNNALKDAYIETGLLVKVPMFIEQGEKIIVTTEDGKYYSRA
ncbi:MAG: elongation factor P [Clostridia bacterium]|nr:elongation factor P [Clostridia bacterium]